MNKTASILVSAAMAASLAAPAIAAAQARGNPLQQQQECPEGETWDEDAGECAPTELPQ